MDCDQEADPQDFDIDGNPHPGESPISKLTELQDRLVRNHHFQKQSDQPNKNMSPGSPSKKPLMPKTPGIHTRFECQVGVPWFNLLDGTLLRHYNTLPISADLKQNLHQDLRSLQCPTMMSFLDTIIDHLVIDSVFKIRLEDWFSARGIVWLRVWFQVVPFPQLFTSNTLEFFHLSAA
ncbi:hypothetical protein WICPIJ_007534 [Wickerhamomyces pijperi]|uniref:Uncharacterized protein n=1 Tax=Wickerhamomyces pijperi TaxID=599730 RepID=A0A9P8TJU9_WICPI|nr:hypothetical protein WICPIJ_007534 [Wickerhamomyces pijperi]